MSFGIVQSAIAAMKNNRNLLSKRKRGKGLDGKYSNEKVEFDLPEATPKQLNDIRERKQRENKKMRLKQVAITTVIMLVILIVVSFYF